MPERRKVLITGAAGLVGGILRRAWADRYDLRLADIRPVEDAGGHEVVTTDIRELEAMRRACEGIDTLVHLAADRSPRADFYATLLDLNIIGAYNGFQAAKDQGCRRIVFASSVNAVLGYPDDAGVEWDVPIFPTNVYGATKCWGEALGHAFELRVNSLGTSTTPPSNRRKPSTRRLMWATSSNVSMFTSTFSTIASTTPRQKSRLS
jgi:uronate dehydrogenase